jgi:hypothetical protein
MAKGNFKLYLFSFLILCLFISASYAKYSGGSGTPEDPYLILSPQDMNSIGANSIDWHKNFKLLADINMACFTGTQYKIIGNDSISFTGVFDGNGHEISNLHIVSNFNDVGLFGDTTNATIINLGVTDANIIANCQTCGVLVGSQFEGTITNCYCNGIVNVSTSSSIASGGLIGNQIAGHLTNSKSAVNIIFSSSSASSAFIGGLIGFQLEANAANCCSTGNITLQSIASSNSCNYAGGLIGKKCSNGAVVDCYSSGNVTSSALAYSLAGGLIAEQGGKVINCYSTGNVSSSSASCDSYAGGLIAFQDPGTVINCYSKGTVSSTVSSDLKYAYAGGFVGYQSNFSSVVIQKCYSTGILNADGNNIYSGGFLGFYGGKGILNACFWDREASESNTGIGSGSSPSVIGLSTSAMKTFYAFTDAGWDFSYTDNNEAVWFMPENDYPILTWQISPVDISTDGKNNFKDFAALSKFWMRSDCAKYNRYCDFADLDFNHSVDLNDLIIFMNFWLEEGIYE